MGKYDSHVVQKSTRRQEKVHPIWRGVGFLFIVLAPIISYAAAVLLIQENNARGWYPMPYDLMAVPGHLFYFGDPLIYLKLILTVAFMLVLFALFMFVTFFVNSMFGRSRYGPYDLPPVAKPRGVKTRAR